MQTREPRLKPRAGGIGDRCAGAGAR